MTLGIQPQTNASFRLRLAEGPETSTLRKRGVHRSPFCVPSFHGANGEAPPFDRLVFFRDFQSHCRAIPKKPEKKCPIRRSPNQNGLFFSPIQGTERLEAVH